jgi:hypothetical protein
MKRLLLISGLFVLVGCGSVPLENKRDAALMPEPVAKRVLVRHLGEAWVNNPHGRYSQGFGQLCGNNGWGPLPFNEINVVRVFQDGQLLMLTKTDWLKVAIPCTQMIYEVKGNFNKEDVKDIVDALVSLGAKIEVAVKP